MPDLSTSLREELGRRLARRPWPATPLQRELDISFEFFPPATPEGADELSATVERLATLNPRFMSVTYGAGGTTRDRTHDTIGRLLETTDLDIAAHLTCVRSSAAEIQATVDRHRDAGVRHIVALRGDDPADGSSRGGELADATALVAAIRARSDGSEFEISVAAYPETHPKAESSRADLENLKRKIDAGADRAITQFFFEPDDFLRFHDNARAAGITVPIVPGIMPVGNFTRIARFADRCGARVPEWMTDLFEGLENAPDVHRMVAATVAAEQCRYLVEHGITSFHFYTLNRADLTLAICRTLGVPTRTLDGRSAAAGVAS